MDPRLELDIRKGYSEYYSEFEGLAIWIGCLLEQLSVHDPLVYSFDVRIKTIDSLLKKIVARMDKEPTACFNDVREQIKDIVGARILVYVPDTLRKLHAFLMDMAPVTSGNASGIIFRKNMFQKAAPDVSRFLRAAYWKPSCGF